MIGTGSLASALQLLLALISTCDAAGVVRIPWTTDAPNHTASFGSGVYGPDGPWQAIWVSFADAAQNYIDQALWPIDSPHSIIKGFESGGNVTFGTAPLNLANEAADHGYGSNYNASYEGWIMATTFNLSSLDGGVPYHVGSLGLQRLMGDGLPSGEIYHNGVLSQLKAAGAITSEFFGLHMGSVVVAQRGSLLLGGYEQNRALGPVGVFRNWGGQIAMMWLRDVMIGVETGSSPFNVSEVGSIYRGLQSSLAADFNNDNGGRDDGAALVIPSPEVPGIYLPLGTCEAAASYLPVTWDKKIQYYLWDTKNPNYTRIVNSPAYLGFILYDTKAKNITIKVPFKLLNLTLERPIVDKPVPYFPCHPYNTTDGYWALGRAFLQAAFLGVNYEQNLTFLAQAPGPDMDQSVIVKVQPNTTTLTTNSIDTFEKTWRSQWTAPESSSTADGPRATLNPKINPPEATNTNTTTATTGLNAEVKVGIAMGATVGIIIAALAGFSCWRRKRDRKRGENAPEVVVDGRTGHATMPQEMDGLDGMIHEIGQPLPHEMEWKPIPQELWGSSSPVSVSEMPAELVFSLDSDCVEDGKRWK
ncbi:hypothetical protein B0T19DRAFT_403931 [Cercophora scortea]|uniref:Peptidase A1 domain-containing protein n=1 Tax=Cercophora scortea TaxID=314031 RepID=A0AAE0IAC2_9PEZI|nr:hypothetical protein B0T19DRAFT_403931 [Cercophora scortea]